MEVKAKMIIHTDSDIPAMKSEVPQQDDKILILEKYSIQCQICSETIAYEFACKEHYASTGHTLFTKNITIMQTTKQEEKRNMIAEKVKLKQEKEQKKKNRITKTLTYYVCLTENCFVERFENYTLAYRHKAMTNHQLKKVVSPNPKFTEALTK